MANDPDTMAAESLKTKNEANDSINIVGDKKQVAGDMLQGISNRAGNVDNVQGPVTGIEASGVDGAFVIHTQSSTLPTERVIRLGADTICQPMASECHDQSCSLSR
jgi:hypothetical protein